MPLAAPSATHQSHRLTSRGAEHAQEAELLPAKAPLGNEMRSRQHNLLHVPRLRCYSRPATEEMGWRWRSVR
jgi:hypothetical protein